MRRSRRYHSISTLVEPTNTYAFDEAVDMLKQSATAKFDETAELKVMLSVKAGGTPVRGTCSLPHGTGKSVRIIAFAKGEAISEAEEAGADHVGGEDLAKRIQDGWFEFDKVVATPDMMPVVGKLGKVLGPRGLMPSPKTGTVTKEIGSVIRDLKKGMVEFRADRTGVIHTIFGKASFDANALRENLVAMLTSIAERKPEEGVKGRFVKKASIASTMGPGIRLKPADVHAIVESVN